MDRLVLVGSINLLLSLEAALMKLDPEDGEQIMEYLKTHALLTREKACKSRGSMPLNDITPMISCSFHTWA